MPAPVVRVSFGFFDPGGPARSGRSSHRDSRRGSGRSAAISAISQGSSGGTTACTRSASGRASRTLSCAPSITILKDGTLYQDLSAAHFDSRHKTASTRRLVQRLQNLGFAVQLTPAPA